MRIVGRMKEQEVPNQCLIIQQQRESKSRVKSMDYKSVRDLAAAADIS